MLASFLGVLPILTPPLCAKILYSNTLIVTDMKCELITSGLLILPMMLFVIVLQMQKKLYIINFQLKKYKMLQDIQNAKTQ
jgi:hypothetical protein